MSSAVHSEGHIFNCVMDYSAFGLDPIIPENGFWFKKGKRTNRPFELSTEQYGSTIVTPDFCKANIASIAGLELIQMSEGYWWDIQDLYVVRKKRA